MPVQDSRNDAVCPPLLAAMMQQETRRKYAFYLLVILAGMFVSILLLTGPLKDIGDDLGAPVVDKGTNGKETGQDAGRATALYAITFLGLAAYGGHLAARFLSDRSWRRKDLYDRQVNWSIADSLMIVLLFVALSLLSGVFSRSQPGGADSGREITVQYVIADIFSHLVVLLFALAILRQRGGRFSEGMGLRLRPHGRLILIGLVAFLAFQPLRLIYTTAVVAFFYGLRLPIEAHPVVDELLKQDRMDLRLSLAFSVVVAAPFFEEIFFRGFLYQALRRRMYPWAAVLATGLLFAIIHPSFFQASLVFPLGLLLAYLMEKTGSLIPCMVVHFLINGTSLLLTFLRVG